MTRIPRACDRCLCGALLVLLAASAAQAQADLRTWTSADGTHKTEANFLDYQNQRVQLQKADGQQLALPLSALSKEDREYVRQAMTRRQKEKSGRGPNGNPRRPRPGLPGTGRGGAGRTSTASRRRPAC